MNKETKAIFVIVAIFGLMGWGLWSWSKKVSQDFSQSYEDHIAEQKKIKEDLDNECKLAQEMDYPDFFDGFKDSEKVKYDFWCEEGCGENCSYFSFSGSPMCRCYVSKKTISHQKKEGLMSYTEEQAKRENIKSIQFYLK